MRTHEDNTILWRELEGVKKFEHDIDAPCSSKSTCSKCHSEFVHCWDKDGKNEAEILCPIPDPFPGPDEVIAERVRLWMNSEENSYAKWVRVLMKKSKDSGWRTGIGREIWMLVECTPADKIKSFISLFKE